MKKATLIVLVLVSVFLSNCKKNSATDRSAPVESEQAILADEATSPGVIAMLTSMRGLPNQDLKRLAYRLLTSHQRYFVWLDHLKLASATFSVAQMSLVNQLTSYITPEILSAKPTDADIAFRNQWLVKAQLVFSDKQISTIAYALYPQNDHLVTNSAGLKTNQADGGGDDGGLADCNCDLGDFHWTCGWLAGTSICPVDYYHADCGNPTKDGCGWFYGQPCNNLCYTPPGAGDE